MARPLRERIRSRNGLATPRLDQVCNNTVCTATVPDIDSTYNGSNIHCVARSASSDPYVNTSPVNAATHLIQVQGDMTKKRNGLKNGPENGPNAFVDLSQGHGLNIYFVIIILIYFYL